MKTIFTVILCALTMSLSAQTKKTPVKSTPKKTTTKTASKPVTKTTAKPVVAVSSSKKTANFGSTADYKTAIGVKFLYGLSLTAKHFLKDKHALEGIFTYRGFSGLGTQIGASIVYEYQQPIKGVQNLQWYVGGGGHLEYFSFDNDLVDPTTAVGVLGVLGLEYKFKGVPIAISADWQPVFTFTAGGGFGAENGGIGVKYTF